MKKRKELFIKKIIFDKDDEMRVRDKHGSHSVSKEPEEDIRESNVRNMKRLVLMIITSNHLSGISLWIPFSS